MCVCVCAERGFSISSTYQRDLRSRERERGFECREVDRVNIFALAKQKKNSANANRN